MLDCTGMLSTPACMIREDKNMQTRVNPACANAEGSGVAYAAARFWELRVKIGNCNAVDDDIDMAYSSTYA